MLGRNKIDNKNTPTVEPKAYAKYLLKFGSLVEKRKLLRSLKTGFVLKAKTLNLVKN
jgi:hypothetical protein